MTLIAVGGDGATTTSLALAAGWPDSADERGLVVVESDPNGGSLAAWLDTPLDPSLSAMVTALHQSVSASAPTGSMWTYVDTMIRRSSTGIRFVPAPFRASEARGPVAEAGQRLLPLLASLDHTIAIADVGRLDPLRLPTAARHAELVVVVHRQDPASAHAATVRLERLAETVDALRTTGHQVALAVLGDEPFPLDEVTAFAAPGAPAWRLAIDPLAAQVLAGRTGVSARRLARLPLMRSAARAAAEISRRHTGHADSPLVDHPLDQLPTRPAR